MYSVEEMHKLLVAGMEFLGLSVVKIEAEHPVLGFGTGLVRRATGEQFGRFHVR